MTSLSNSPAFGRVAVIGAGAMGRGIAQMCAQAGSTVFIYDTAPTAIAAAQQALHETWATLAAKGKIDPATAQIYADRLIAAPDLLQLSHIDLVIEAVVEKLEVKQTLFQTLQTHLGPQTVLASNTSSLSITAIGAALSHPQQLLGYHFFNPVPLMRVVEVIAGLKSDSSHAQRLCEYAQQFGHAPVMAQDTPGFIVNHAGRGYGTEALKIVGEQITDFASVDRILKDQLGFRLGPFELFDLTGLDVSHPVMSSIYHQYFEEPRYRPSVITAQRLAGGLLGKKTGQGFYDYDAGQIQQPAEPSLPVVNNLPPVWVPARAARRAELYQLLKHLDATIETTAQPSAQALIIVAPLGHDITTVAAVEQLDPSRTVGIDMLVSDANTKRRVLATNPATRIDMRDAAHALFGRDGKAVSMIRDSGGFVSQRVLANIVNIASDICQQGICTPNDLETAVRLGLGYPKGPLQMGDDVGAASILEILFNLQTVYGDPRYRPSPWLRRRGALGLSLQHVEA